jgi:cytoskeletal protein RodZ
MEGVLKKLNRPKALVIVVVIAFIINALLFYRYQHNLSEALAAGPSLAAAEPSSIVSTAAPTSFAVPAEQKASSPAKKTDAESKGILASALDTLGLAPSSGSSQIPYVPLSHLSASSPKETHDAPVDANSTGAPSTEEVAPAADREVNEQALDAAATPTVLGPASVPDDEEPEPKERPSAASPIAPPAPQNSTESADTAPNGALRESAPEEDESTERGEALWQPPPDEETHPPSGPVERTGPPLAPTSQAQCRDRGFAAFGFENEDECLSLVTSQGSQAKDKRGEDEKR